MQIRTDEIADGVFRFSTFMADVTPEGLTFNQFLLLSEDPLLFHWGQRALFPLVSEAVARILPIDRLRWLSFGHVEADECGAMNAWLAAAPHAQVVNGALACNLSLNDLCDRAAVISIDGADRIFDDEGEWTQPLSAAQLGLYVSPSDPLAAAVLNRADLGPRTFLLADPDGAFNRLLRTWMKTVMPRPRFESAGSVDGVKRGIQNSDAIAVPPTYAVAEEIMAGSLVALTLREPLPALTLMLTALERPAQRSPQHKLIEEVAHAFSNQPLVEHTT